AGEHIVSTDKASVKGRWQLVNQQSRNTAPSFVFMKTTEPKLIIHPLLRALEIHPDDVQYGYRLYGLVVDVVEKRVTQMTFINDFHNLKANEQGRIELSSEIPDPAGKFTPVKLSLKVTDRAIRRGKNLSFFEQSKYCGKCEFYGEM